MDGEGRHAGGDIAAVTAEIHEGDIHAHLTEGIVDVSVRPGGGPDDGHLGGGDVRAAQAVQLPEAGAAEDGQDHLLPGLGVRRQLIVHQEDRFAGPAPDDGAADRDDLIAHTHLSSSS